MSKVIVLFLSLQFMFGGDFVTSAISGANNSSKLLKLQKNNSYKGFFLVKPKKEYASDYVEWWSRPNAIAFNPTKDLNVSVYAKYFEYVASNQNENVLNSDRYIWFVMSDKSGEIVANVGVHSVDTYAKFGYIFYVVSNKYEHQGVGTKSVYLLLEKLFEQLDFYKVYAAVVPENVNSIKILKKHGFKEEGFLRKHYIVGDGKRKDMKLFGLLKSEWDEMKKALTSDTEITKSPK